MDILHGISPILGFHKSLYSVQNVTFPRMEQPCDANLICYLSITLKCPLDNYFSYLHSLLTLFLNILYHVLA